MYDGRANGSIKREASMLEQMVSASPSEIAQLSLVEKETLTVDPLITGQLSVRREVATLFGKTYYSQEPEIIVSAYQYAKLALVRCVHSHKSIHRPTGVPARGGDLSQPGIGYSDIDGQLGVDPLLD